jgi:aspartyl-tRNA synthetase
MCNSVLPFEVKTSQNANEDTRLKYRFLDLRNPEVHDNILFRTNVISFIRETMKSMDFTEIQTPIITASSPEGARDFIVPSRKNKGKFYALPQAPQIFKQLLMVSGFNKYFQIAPCFRDEDPRSDRLYGEFYQLDFEMSFAEQEDVFEVGERVFYDVFKKFGNKEVSPRPFRRISFNAAMLKYGSDKPDLRNPLIITDLTDVFSETTFEPFKNTPIRGIYVENIEKSNSWFNEIEEYAKSIGLKGISIIRVQEDNSFKGGIDKYLTEKERENLRNLFNLKHNSALFIIADKEKVNKYSGLIRIKLGESLELIDKSKFEFCIINDFPMYEYNEETNGYDFTHNPFTMPQGGLDSLLNKKTDEILAYQYDFECNGIEVASGGVRNYSIEILKKAFELAGYGEEEVKRRFTSLYNAFQYGAPPHAGMAPGIDRILMLLKDEENIREIVAFPMSSNGLDLLMGAPGEVSEKQLREAHIKIRE